MRRDADRCKLVHNSPRVANLRRRVSGVSWDGSSSPSVQIDADPYRISAGRTAPFSAPDGTIVGTFLTRCFGPGWPIIGRDQKKKPETLVAFYATTVAETMRGVAEVFVELKSTEVGGRRSPLCLASSGASHVVERCQKFGHFRLVGNESDFLMPSHPATLAL